MELLVRSQDKEALMPIKEGIWYCYDEQKESENKHCIENYHCELGAYSTKERALEVLDEIQEIIKPKIITTSYECECKDNPLNKMSFNLEMIPTKTEIQELSTIVYEMPKE